jgi:hypothetical protein
MNRGFAHFDGAHTENFSAAMLCLVLEVVPEASVAFAGLLEQALERQLGALRRVEREHRLDGTDTKGYQRADLCLWFESGDLVLVEVKTRWWPVDEVIAQMKEQAASDGPVMARQMPSAVVLLAPTGLAASVVQVMNGSPSQQFAAMTWSSLMRALEPFKLQPIVAKAITHWQGHVERSFGLDGVGFDGVENSIQVIACLRELLRACATDIGERPEDGLNLTGWAGESFELDGWRWHGMSVSLKPKDGRSGRLGLYYFTSAPSGEEASHRRWFLELYLHDPNVPHVWAPFDPLDLGPASLDAIRHQFGLAVTGDRNPSPSRTLVG